MGFSSTDLSVLVILTIDLFTFCKFNDMFLGETAVECLYNLVVMFSAMSLSSWARHSASVINFCFSIMSYYLLTVLLFFKLALSRLFSYIYICISFESGGNSCSSLAYDLSFLLSIFESMA